MVHILSIYNSYCVEPRYLHFSYRKIQVINSTVRANSPKWYEELTRQNADRRLLWPFHVLLLSDVITSRELHCSKDIGEIRNEEPDN
jgi:hypothetical protein